MISEQKRALDNITEIERESRERALLIAGLLGLVGVAVLFIGFITAHAIARRFGAPIEALVQAADNIGQGNFEVTLPISSAVEMNQLSRRFGIMAEALREHQATNIDELLAGQQRLQAVLDSIDDGLLIIDRQGHLEHLNPVAQRQLGWDTDRLGQGLGTALERPELDEQLQLVLRGGTLERAPDDLSIEVDGESRLLTYSLTPVSHTQGHILGAVMVLHDVTEQRAFERVRSEFVLRASHELRTPVTGMHMAFGLFRERTHFCRRLPRSRPAGHRQRRNAAPDAVDQRPAEFLSLSKTACKKTHAGTVLHRRLAGSGPDTFLPARHRRRALNCWWKCRDRCRGCKPIRRNWSGCSIT